MSDEPDGIVDLEPDKKGVLRHRAARPGLSVLAHFHRIVPVGAAVGAVVGMAVYTTIRDKYFPDLAGLDGGPEALAVAAGGVGGCLGGYLVGDFAKVKTWTGEINRVEAERQLREAVEASRRSREFYLDGVAEPLPDSGSATLPMIEGRQRDASIGKLPIRHLPTYSR